MYTTTIAITSKTNPNVVPITSTATAMRNIGKLTDMYDKHRLVKAQGQHVKYICRSQNVKKVFSTNEHQIQLRMGTGNASNRKYLFSNQLVNNSYFQ